MAGKDLLQNRLKQLNESKEVVKQGKSNVVESLVTGEEKKPDFMKMAEVLNSQVGEQKSINDDYKKDTLYIRRDLYEAMQALTEGKQGMKKKLVNEAYEMFLTKVYNERVQELDIDK